MDEVLINTTTTGSQGGPAITGFRGTQFVAVWADGVSNIKAQLLSPGGLKTDSEFIVNFPAPPGTRRQGAAIVEFARGFAVAWLEAPPGPSTPDTPFHLKLRTFNEDTLSGPEIQVSSAVVERFVRPALARLADGGFVLVWADRRENERIRVQRFSPDGDKVGAEFRANTLPGLHRYPMAAGLADGNFVVGWRARLTGPLTVHFQMYDPTGGPVGSEQTTTPEITEATMAPLDSEQFVIAHIRSPADDGEPLDTTVAQASVFAPSGAFSGRRFAATASTRILSLWAALAPLSGGRFVLCWTESKIDSPAAGTNVMARLFSQDRGPIGQPVRVNTSSGHERFSLQAAVIEALGRTTLFAVWTDQGVGRGDASGSAVRGRPLDIPAGGF